LREAETQPETPTDLWSTGNAQLEAKEFAAMVGRNGWTVEELRADISISPDQMFEFDQWCEREPSLAWRIRKMIFYRNDVLNAFNALVKDDAALTSSQDRGARFRDAVVFGGARWRQQRQ